jgi:hypothetical protein
MNACKRISKTILKCISRLNLRVKHQKLINFVPQFRQILNNQPKVVQNNSKKVSPVTIICPDLLLNTKKLHFNKLYNNNKKYCRAKLTKISITKQKVQKKSRGNLLIPKLYVKRFNF